MKILRYLILSLFLLITASCAVEKPPSCEAIKKYVQENMTEYGVLRQDSQGFVYLDLDDAFIHQLNAFIRDQGFDEPPYFGSGLHGAHITVIDAEEAKKYDIRSIEEIGTIFTFQITGCQTFPMQPSKDNPAFDWKEGDLAYIILVDSPELVELRKKYGLPEKKYPFHITIGIKYLQSQAA